MKLSQLKVGEKAIVTSTGTDSLVRRRLMDLGLIRGTELKVLRVAPLGDPVEILFKGLYLTLRRSEAEGIVVRLASEEGSGTPPTERLVHRFGFGRAS